MIFKTIKLEERQKLVQGHIDLLSKEHQEEKKYFSSLSCIRCGEIVYPVLNVKRPFREGKLTPNMLAKCSVCEVEFEPYTKIEVSPPKIATD